MRYLFLIFIFFSTAYSGPHGSVEVGTLFTKAVTSEYYNKHEGIYTSADIGYGIKKDGIIFSIFTKFETFGEYNWIHGQLPFRIIYTIGFTFGSDDIKLKYSHFCSHPVQSVYNEDFLTANGIVGEHDKLVLRWEF